MGLAVWLQVGAACWLPFACKAHPTGVRRASLMARKARNAFPKHAVAPNGGLGRRTPELGVAARERAGKKPESLMGERVESAEIMGLQDAWNLIPRVFAASVVAFVLERAVLL